MIELTIRPKDIITSPGTFDFGVQILKVPDQSLKEISRSFLKDFYDCILSNLLGYNGPSRKLDMDDIRDIIEKILGKFRKDTVPRFFLVLTCNNVQGIPCQETGIRRNIDGSKYEPHH